MENLGKAQRQRLDLNAIKRLWWQRTVLNQPIPIAPLALDQRTCCPQAVDVPIKRAQRHPHLLRQARGSVFGGDLVVISYMDAGNIPDPAETNQVMWGQIVAESGFRVMAYDVPSQISWRPGETPFFVSVRGDAADEITRYWEKLTESATIAQSLEPSGWSPLHSMLKDRFGVTWTFDVESYSAAS